MPPEEILVALQRSFTPLTMHPTDGRDDQIRHPELIIPGKRAVIVGLPANSTEPYYERLVTIGLLHITRLEPIDEQSVDAGGQN